MRVPRHRDLLPALLWRSKCRRERRKPSGPKPPLNSADLARRRRPAPSLSTSLPPSVGGKNRNGEAANRRNGDKTPAHQSGLLLGAVRGRPVGGGGFVRLSCGLGFSAAVATMARDGPDAFRLSSQQHFSGDEHANPEAGPGVSAR